MRLIDADAIVYWEDDSGIKNMGYVRKGQIDAMPTIEPKRDFEVVVNEACLNCELDCVEVVRCHDCRNYEEAKNSCNGLCKEWNTSTYTWDYCSKGERKDEVE